MPANTTTKLPAPASDKPVDEKFDPFRPQMPKIPGVSQAQTGPGSRSGSGGADLRRLLQVGGIVAVVVVVGIAILWWVRNKPRAATDTPAAEAAATEPSPSPLPPYVAPVQEGPTVAATVDELSKPWSAKKFTFIKPVTQESIDAEVIRLPGGGLWAFALQSPYGRCELEFVTDLNRIASQFGYRASHPVVVSPCDNTVFDPLQVGALGGSTWARGEIVHGSALRPPFSIDVHVSGRSIIADRAE